MSELGVHTFFKTSAPRSLNHFDSANKAPSCVLLLAPTRTIFIPLSRNLRCRGKLGPS